MNKIFIIICLWTSILSNIFLLSYLFEQENFWLRAILTMPLFYSGIVITKLVIKTKERL